VALSNCAVPAGRDRTSFSPVSAALQEIRAKDDALKENSAKTPLVHLNSLGGREKQKFEHLREIKDLAVAWPPETITVAI
jgi:hypothetical protein